MHEFSVWAPLVHRLLLDLPGSGRRLPMLPQGGGWWRLAVEDAGHGTDYGFVLHAPAGDPLPGTDGSPRADPRSGWQPDGVEGLSRVFDPGRHPWTDAGWAGLDVLGRVFYELHVGTFTAAGTLDSAIERLDHLVDLGIEVVELLPLAPFPGERGWGYDGVHLYAVHEPYGGPAALQRFVDACHRRGLAVCLDAVYNHLGPTGNHLREFGPYFTGRHETPWGEAVNLDDDGAGEVRAWILDNAARWFADFHIDALRLDAVHELRDASVPHLLANLSDQTRRRSERLGRPLGLVAESDLNDPVVIDSTAAGGYGMTAQWDDDVHHALHALLTGERQGYYADFGSTAVLGRTMTRAFRHAGDWSSFRGEVWGRPIDPARHRGHRFVTFLQNHDQIGNRAAGDRLSESLSPGRLAAGAALLLLSPFTPLLFMGEEWAASTPWQFFTSYPDPQLAEAVREGREREFAEFGWADEVPDPQDPATRDRSVLDWSELDTEGPGPGSGIEHRPMLAWYRSLISLRRGQPDLLDDDLRAVRVDAGDTWLVLHRGRFRVLVNLAPEPASLCAGEPDRQPTVLLAWGEAEPEPGGIRLAPDAVAVVDTGDDADDPGADPVADAAGGEQPQAG